MLALLALAVLAGPAQAQDRVVSTLRVDAWDVADLSWVHPPPGEPVRVLVRGSLTNARDGSELDAMRTTTHSRVIEGSPLVLPAGTTLVEERGPHAYLLEIPAGHGASIGLNTVALAGRLLVPASEVRSAITGAILVDVLAPSSAPPIVEAPPMPSAAAPSSMTPLALGGAAIGIPLVGLVGLVLSRRRIRREDALVGRARRARSAIEREAKELGPAFDGALASARALGEAAEHQRAHLAAIDRALARTAWVRSAAAGAQRATLTSRRIEAIGRLDEITTRLEESVVRMAACVADRGAIAGLERDLRAMKSELEVGELVLGELDALGRSP
jgi:hypothetical protein